MSNAALSKLTAEELKRLLDFNPAVTVRLDHRSPYTVTCVIGNTAALLGLELQEIVDNPEFWVTCVHPDDAERVLRGIQVVADAGRGALEYRLRQSDGGYRWVRSALILVLDSDDQPLEIIGYLIDITKQDQADESLGMAEVLDETAMRANTEFLANFSHDLRGPLNAVIGFSEVLESEIFGPHADGRYKQYATDIRESGLHLLQVIDDTLEIGRIGAGVAEPQDPGESSPEAVGGSSGDAAIQVPNEAAADQVADGQIAQPGLTVLIAEDNHSVLRSLTPRCKELGLNVRDVSRGPDAVTAILEKSYDLLILDVQLKAADGLTVWDALEQGGWRAPESVILLTDRSDTESIRRFQALGVRHVRKGIDAWFQLGRMICELLNIEAEHPGGGGAELAAGNRPAGSASSPKVLVIDDDPHVSKIIGVKLEALGVTVLRAFSGMEGYGIALREKPDVVITDYTMPNGNGEYVITRMRNTPETKEIPAIVLTAWTMEGKPDHGLERDLTGRLGASAYLTKPLDFDALLAALEKHVPLAARAAATPVPAEA